jgi:hypothetical protein
VSAKPASLPIWATAVGAQITEPNLAKKQQGHLGGEPFFGDYDNWYKHLVYLWTQYLSDGQLSGGLSIEGETAVTGGGLTVEDSIAAGLDVFYSTPRRRHLPALAGKIVSGVNDGSRWSDTQGTWLGQIGEILQIPLAVEQGDRISSVSARVLEVVDHVSMRLWRMDANSTSPTRTQIGATQTSVGGGIHETLTISGLAENVPAGFVNYYIEFTVTNDGGGGVQVFAVTYNVSRPPP